MVINSYRHNARKRGLVFALDRTQVKDLTSAECHYCGARPSSVTSTPAKSYSAEGSKNAEYVYNGIDRVDNSKGYIPGNCVPCCAGCNTWKSAQSVEEFIGRARAIAQRHP